MTTSEWKRFQDAVPEDEYVKAYFEFMYDWLNAHNCGHCPMNDGLEDLQSLKLPCGQQNCWVIVHCRHD